MVVVSESDIALRLLEKPFFFRNCFCLKIRVLFFFAFLTLMYPNFFIWGYHQIVLES